MTIFIIGQRGDPKRLWIVDTDKGTVQPFSGGSGSGGIDQGTARTIENMRGHGFSVVKDVDVAVAVPTTADLTSRQFSGNA